MTEPRRQIQLRLRPNTHRAARLEAAARGVSVNHFLSELLEDALVLALKKRPANEVRSR